MGEALEVLGVEYIDFLILRLGAGHDENNSMTVIAQGMKVPSFPV